MLSVTAKTLSWPHVVTKKPKNYDLRLFYKGLLHTYLGDPFSTAPASLLGSIKHFLSRTYLTLTIPGIVCLTRPTSSNALFPKMTENR